jgi:carotenoid cleavage oxygenase
VVPQPLCAFGRRRRDPGRPARPEADGLAGDFAPNPYELTYDLDTVGRTNFDGTLEGPYTPHPVRDPDTGELHAVSYFAGWGNRVQYTVIGTDARVRRTVSIECTGSPAMHSFSLTENHVVVYDLPVTFDLGAVPPGANPNSMSLFPYRWDLDYPARIGVMPRDGDADDVRWIEIEPCYVFHTMNAFEEAGRIVIDAVRHPKMFAAEIPGPHEHPPTLDRWTIDLEGGRVKADRLDDRAQEFPRIDERRNGHRHRFGYSVGGRLDVGDNVLHRHDFDAHRHESRSFGPGKGLSEFVFVPTGPDAPEADGLLVGYVYDGSSNTSDLVLVDAATLDTVAAVHLPVRVPNGFHGNWLPDSAE